MAPIPPRAAPGPGSWPPAVRAADAADPCPHPPARGPGALERAREAIQTDHRPPRGVVRQPILASWMRSMQHDVPSADLELGDESDRNPDSLLARVARPIIDDMADLLATEPVSIILCDGDGVVLDRRTGDSHLRQHLDHVWLAPGFSYAESNVGTNGIGTALESRGPAHVFGQEHWVENLDELACAGTPIRHPRTGKVVGVLDLTGWCRDANAMMITTASMVATRIEEALFHEAGRHELALLQDYMSACQRNRGVVLAVSDDLLMLNDRARAQLDPGDQAPLVAVGTDALRAGRRSLQVVDLPSGATVRLRCRPTEGSPGAVGGVLLVQFLDRGPEATRATVPPPSSTPTAVGNGALWAMCRQVVDRHFLNREWIMLAGEAGSGMRTLARATHQARTPAGHLRVLDAAEFDEGWLEEVAAELEQDHGGTLVLARLDLLAPEAMGALTEVLEPYRESTQMLRPWLVGTIRPTTPTPELSALTDTFPRTVDVPPLRHHPEDVPDLVAHFMNRMTRRGELTCSSAAMRMLMRHPWPGNVEQLQQVIRKVVAARRTGVIEVGDLPSEIWTTARRVLTPLEAIECDAIVKTLLKTGGSKPEAAQLLGMSRATIYRKIREYGISVP